MKGLLDFKTDRVRQEWDNPLLRDKAKSIVIALGTYSWYLLQKRMIITHVYRSDKEQRDYYPDNPRKISVHQFWRGIDIRSWIYSQEEIETLVKIANTVPYDRARPSKKTAIYHSIGRGNHVHIQCLT